MLPVLGDEIVTRHRHVGQRGVQRGVAKQLLECERIATCSQVGNRKRVPQLVRSDMNSLVTADPFTDLVQTGWGQGISLF
jgi:hypothetical protein